MRSLKNRAAVVGLAAAVLAGSAVRAAEGLGWFDPESALQKGREALFEKRYADAARVCTTVYLENPANGEARRCLREAALAGATDDVLAVQEEGGQIMKSVEKKRHMSELMRQRRWLEAYDLLYGALEADLSDDWSRGQLEKLQRAVGERAGGLEAKDDRSRKAVLGFYEMTQGKWPSVLRARGYWFAALSLTGANIPEVRIRRYLARIERQELRLKTARASGQPGPAETATMKDIYKELDELLK
ncbi:MAG: hypothetical protein HY403_04485 [Elusimicrobia bacterium]|nr:hypothetical protein [Elusimicrobiota bacterium]